MPATPIPETPVRLRGVVLRVHLILALIVGLLLSVVTVSGALVLFRPELDRLAAARPTGAAGRADLDAVVADLTARYGDERLGAFAAGGSHDTWSLRSGGERSATAVTWKAYTDPATGTWLGDTRDSASCAVTAWVARFHHDLWLKPVGGILVGSAGLALLGFVVSGLWLWWPGVRRLGGAFVVRWNKGAFLRHYDLHRLLGLIGIPVFILIGVTGAMFEFRWMRVGVHAVLGGTEADKPAFMRAQPARPPAAGEKGMKDDKPRTPAPTLTGWSRVRDVGEQAAPGTRMLLIAPPRPGGGEQGGTWRVVLDYPGNASPRGGVIATIARQDFAVREMQDPRTMSLGGWVLNQDWGLHMGTFGGLPTRILYVIVGLLPPVLLFTGLGLWLHRRRKGSVSSKPVTADRPAGEQP